jgi:hypothetical protein
MALLLTNLVLSESFEDDIQLNSIRVILAVSVFDDRDQSARLHAEFTLLGKLASERSTYGLVSLEMASRKEPPIASSLLNEQYITPRIRDESANEHVWTRRHASTPITGEAQKSPSGDSWAVAGATTGPTGRAHSTALASTRRTCGWKYTGNASSPGEK